MTGLARSTVSPSSSIMMRSTPWVDGCCGPMLRIIVSSMSGHGPPVSTSSRACDSPVSGRSCCVALVGLRLEASLLGVVGDRVALDRIFVVDLDDLVDRVQRLFAHRGLGSPLKVTGTRAGASSLRSG